MSDASSSQASGSFIHTKGDTTDNNFGILSRGKEEDVFESQSSFLTGAFGVLFSVSKERVTPLAFFIFKYVFDWLQLFTLICNNQFGWTMNPDNKVWIFVGYFQIQPLMTLIGYTPFTVLTYIFAALLAFNVGVIFWVYRSFQSQHFDVWTIKFLRNFGYIFYQVLDIMSLTLFLTALDCQYYDIQAPNLQYHNNQFPDVYCFSAKHLPLFVIASICVIVFVILAGFFIMGEMEMDPTGKNWDAMVFTKGEILIFGVKVLMTMSQVFIGNYKHLAVIWFIGAFILFYMVLKWVPMIYDWTNHLRVGIYSSILYISILFMALQFPPSRIADDPDESVYYDYKKQLEIALWGILPTFVLGMALSALRLWYFHDFVLNQFKTMPPGTKTTTIVKFTDAREVEILSRCARKWRSDESLDYAAVALAERVMRAGLLQLPLSATMAILYSNFLFHVQDFYQSGINQLQAAKKLRPTFLDRFAIFSREQEHQQKFSAGSRPGRALDLVAFVEFQKHYRMALKVHQDALMSVRQFWELLLRTSPNYEALTKAVKKINTTVQRAEQVYREVLQRHSNNSRMLRMYAKFLERVKHDPWSAAKWMTEADKLDQQEDNAKNSLFGLDQNTEELAPEALSQVRSAMLQVGSNGKEVAVVVINTQSTILITNQAATEMFGYNKSELRGKSVSLLVPPPAAEFHHSYIRNYVEAESTSSNVIDKTVPFLALHKDRYIFPIQLTVTKISGIRDDSRFMGLIEATPMDPCTAMIWILPTGQVLSVDSTFTDWFGYKPTDLDGSTTASLVQCREVDSLLKQARASMLSPPSPALRPAATPMTAMSLRPSPSMATQPPDNSVARAMSPTEDSHSLWTTIVNAAFRPMGREFSERGDGLDPSGSPFANNDGSLSGRLPLVDQEWVAKGVKFNHKFTDPVVVDVNLQNAGTGALRFHIIRLTFATPPKSQFMLVSDPKGRILHVTKNLADILGSTPKVLMANNIPNALENILPEPFSHLHRFLGTNIPNSAPPPYSCRSGLSMLLQGGQGDQLSQLRPKISLGEAPLMFPFKLQMSRRMWVDEVYHVMTLQHLSIEEALDERRLRLVMDENGTVSEVGDSPSSLFGFEPSTMLGLNISVILDVLKQGTGNRREQTLIELASQSLDLPGISWKVGVTVPIADHVQRAENPSGLSLVASSMLAKKMKPAVMQLELIGLEGDKAGIDGISICMELWRADMLTHVIEVDSNSKIVPTTGEMKKLYPAGMAFGLPDIVLTGHPISNFFHLDGRTMKDLLEVAVDRSNTKSRGGLKASMRNGYSQQKRVGPTYNLKVKHVGDARDTFMSTQVVRKLLGGGYLLVCHPYNPVCGLPDFLNFLGGKYRRNLNSLMDLQKRVVPLLDQTNPLAALSKRREKSSVSLKSTYPLAKGHKSLLHSVRSKQTSEGSIPNAALLKLSTLQVQHSSASPEPDDDTLKGEGSSHSVPFSRLPLQVHRAGPSSEIKETRYTQLSPRETPALMEELPVGERPKPITRNVSFNDRPDISLPFFPIPKRDPSKLSFGSDGHPPDPTTLDSGGIPDSPQGSETRLTPLATVEEQPMPSGQEGLAFRQSSFNSVQSFVLKDGTCDLEHGPGSGADFPSPLANEYSYPELNQGGDYPYNGYDPRMSSTYANSMQRHEVIYVPEDAFGGVDENEYRKGVRFKKLMKVFNNTVAQQKLRRFKWLTIICVGFLVAVQTGLFVLMYQLLEQQQREVQTLENMGVSCRQAMNIVINVRLLAMHFAPKPNGYVNEDLPLMAPNPANISGVFLQLNHFANTFKDLHMGAYMGYSNHRQLTTDHGIRDLWEQPTLVETTIFQDYSSQPINPSNPSASFEFRYTQKNISLFELGMAIISSSLDIVHNGLSYNETIVNASNPNGHWENWTEVQFVMMNTPETLARAYMLSLDAMVEVVVDSAAYVNDVQLIILVVEGIVLTSAAIIFMWFISSNFINHRYKVYSVFLAVPLNVINQLATQKLSLGESSEEDDSSDDDRHPEESGMHPLEARNTEQTPPTPQPKVHSSTKPIRWNSNADSDKGNSSYSARAVWIWLCSLLPFTKHGKAAKARKRAKKGRKLQVSARTFLWVTFPFFLWGIIVVAINGAGYTMLRKISAPIAIYNIVNVVILRFHACIYYANELIFNGTPEVQGRLSAALGLWMAEYEIMLLGQEARLAIGSSLVDRSHYRLVQNGVTFSQTRVGSKILYYTKDCLDTSPTTCLAPGSPYYPLTHNGLDILVRETMELLQGVSSANDTTRLTTHSPEFSFYWSTRNSTIGGYSMMNYEYHDEVLKVYSSVRDLHIVAFALTVALMLAFLVFMLRPFLQDSSREQRRIAELLCQLPSEIEVETLLKKVIVSSKHGSNNKVSQSLSRKQSTIGRKHSPTGASMADIGVSFVQNRSGPLQEPKFD